MIYHIVTSEEWLAHRNLPTYSPKAFAQEGFIHCCTEPQLAGVIERYYQGVQTLIILHIDENRLSSPLKYEEATNKELFPHVYGTINKEAIIKVIRK